MCALCIALKELYMHAVVMGHSDFDVVLNFNNSFTDHGK